MAPLAGLISFLSPFYLDQMPNLMDHSQNNGTIFPFHFLVETPETQGSDYPTLIFWITYGAFLPLYAYLAQNILCLLTARSVRCRIHI